LAFSVFRRNSSLLPPFILHVQRILAATSPLTTDSPGADDLGRREVGFDSDVLSTEARRALIREEQRIALHCGVGDVVRRP
jgi:hypothetical protein